jgi:hypothetical protein
MKKLKQRKGFVIAESKNTDYKFHVYTKEEWSYGEGCRYPEWEADSLNECIEFIDNY